MCVLALLLVVASAKAAPPQPQTPTDQSACAIVPGIVAQVGKIRGLTSKGPVPCYVKNKDEVATSLKSLVKEKIPENRLEYEGTVYKAIGLIPADFDYAKGLIELYVSQLGGYYDPSHKYFVMAGWIPAAFQVPVAAHELTHALQDQYFDLNAFTNPSIDNGDTLLARSALIEGDATAAMMDFVRKASGQKPLSEEKDVSSILLQNLAGGGFSPTVSKFPQALQLTLYFPYTSGLRFAHELLRRGKYKAIDEAFKNPPVATSQILHPEKYFDTSYKVANIDDVQLAHGCKILHRDTIGEFIISALLSQDIPDKSAVSQAAAGWAGDRVLLTECAHGARVVRWRTVWETDLDRTEFLNLFKLNGGLRDPDAETPNSLDFVWSLGAQTTKSPGPRTAGPLDP